MKKYYIMAILEGVGDAMLSLGWYYRSIEINHDFNESIL